MLLDHAAEPKEGKLTVCDPVSLAVDVLTNG